MTMPDVADTTACVEWVRAFQRDKRRGALQLLIGATTDSSTTLHRRALLLTALREAEVWPVA